MASSTVKYSKVRSWVFGCCWGLVWLNMNRGTTVAAYTRRFTFQYHNLLVTRERRRYCGLNNLDARFIWFERVGECRETLHHRCSGRSPRNGRVSLAMLIGGKHGL
ncbi:hypothetical protein QBC33DRAFT_545576 [Phialemonium atrogriseum]|uniref:Uncharacterized protein n=1 Tax=Phialemonium atrogriseum TaxID=1093897 RepID=A0AAJ0BV36_9PEZI|nr:uncharacterized protein QBC33DRAFT_545576 [Phialemonium atrogriseum]KAK1765039.1 hypothetical protein QBC33DRAFT_545576 [Phialemonium atrogriseum]